MYVCLSVLRTLRTIHVKEIYNKPVLQLQCVMQSCINVCCDMEKSLTVGNF